MKTGYVGQTQVVYWRHIDASIRSEDELCRECVSFFDSVIEPSRAKMVHVPNGGARNPIEGKKFKQMGVRAGFPDYIILANDFTGFMEFKFGKNKLQPNQAVFRDWVIGAGFEYALIRSVRDFIETLKKWGVYKEK